jgi:general secretion pathway protein K
MRRKTAGVALVSVLWVLVLLTVLAAAAAAGLRNEARLAANLVAAAQARAAAEGGVQLALFHLAVDGKGRWQTDGSVHELRVGEATVKVVLADEAGKADLNFAPQPLLENLLSPAIAERIVERRKHAQFETVEELQGIPGMQPDLFRKVRWLVTVHSRQPGVVADAAPREVLLAIPGADARDVDRYIGLRAHHRQAGLEPPPPPSGQRHYLVRNGSATASIHAQASLPNGARARVAGTFDLRRPGHEAPFRVLEWRHEAEELF